MTAAVKFSIEKSLVPMSNPFYVKVTEDKAPWQPLGCVYRGSTWVNERDSVHFGEDVFNQSHQHLEQFYARRQRRRAQRR